MKGKGIFWIALVGVFVMSAAFSANAQTPGVTDKEVTIGWTTPLSGPAAAWGAAAMGGKAWADYVNEQGGVNGRKIKVVIKDDGYNPARALANLQEMKGQVFAVVGLNGTALLSACRDFFSENKVVLVGAFGNSRIWVDYPKEKIRYIFVAFPDFGDEAEFLTREAVNRLGAKKIALFYQNDDWGKVALQGMNEALTKLGGKAQAVAAVPYEVTDRALDTHALKLKESSADALLVYATPTHTALILRGIAKIDYRPKILSNGTNSNPIMFKIAGDVWEGVYTASSIGAGIPGTDPEADRVAGILKKYEPKIEGNEYLAVFGSAFMMMTVEGLKRAGKELTTEKMIQAMESIKEWKPDIGAPVTFGPGSRQGINGSRLLRAEGGKYIPVTGVEMFKTRF